MSSLEVRPFLNLLELEKDQSVFIMFKHEDFQPVYMTKEEGDEFPNVTLMVPDARIFFFYLVDFEMKVQIDAPKIFLAETDHVQFNLLEQEYEYQVDMVNFMDVQGNVPCVFEEYERKVSSKPRFLRKQYMPKGDNPRVWSFHNSIFRHFKKDNEVSQRLIIFSIFLRGVSKLIGITEGTRVSSRAAK